MFCRETVGYADSFFLLTLSPLTNEWNFEVFKFPSENIEMIAPPMPGPHKVTIFGKKIYETRKTFSRPLIGVFKRSGLEQVAPFSFSSNTQHFSTLTKKFQLLVIKINSFLALIL